MVTFGEMADVAEAHRAEADAALGTGTFAEHPAVLAELRRTMRTLTRYADQLATRFGTADTEPDTDVRIVGRLTGEALRRAFDRVGEPPSSGPNTPPLALSLRAASIALGCGLDLLNAHVTPSSAPSLGDAAVIVTAETARDLAGVLSKHVGTVGGIMAHLGSPHAGNAADLGYLAELLEEASAESVSGLPAIPFPLIRPPVRAKPGVGEPADDKIDGIHASIDRLRFVDPDAPDISWSYMTRALAIATQLNGLLIWTLGDRTRDMRHRASSRALNRTWWAMKSVTTEWKRTSRIWAREMPGPRLPADPAAIDASDLVLRMGRLIFDDPAWRPGPGSTIRRSSSRALLPGPADIQRLGVTAMRITEVSNVLARAHRAAIHNARLVKDATPDYAFARYRGRWLRQLAARSEDLTLLGNHCLVQLGEALSGKDLPTSTVNVETRLIARRAAAGRSARPERNDFPIALGEAPYAQAGPISAADSPARRGPAARGR